MRSGERTASTCRIKGHQSRQNQRRPAALRRSSQGGFTLLWLLAAVAVVGIGLSVVGPLWARKVQREREALLIRVGVAYVNAIERYRRFAPQGHGDGPRDVSDLLQDPRFPGAHVRYLRDAYDDPMRPGNPMRLLRSASGDIVGVASLSADTPLLQTPWTDGRHSLPVAAHYSDWNFLASPTQ